MIFPADSLHLLIMTDPLSILSNAFMPISLEEMQEVRLMDRVDVKYVITREQLPFILEAVQKHYRVFSQQGVLQQAYATRYFDTPDLQMYRAHHNRKLHRHKIRIRQYKITDEFFLEVKHKSNKGRTRKTRIPLRDQFSLETEEAVAFVSRSTPYDIASLRFSLDNDFRRTTLVSNSMDERITIDTELGFNFGQKCVKLDHLVIIELKKSGRSAKSPFQEVLFANGLKPNRFSKYCTGICLMHDNIKYNRFKLRFKKLNKLLQKGGYPYVFDFK